MKNNPRSEFRRLNVLFGLFALVAPIFLPAVSRGQEIWAVGYKGILGGGDIGQSVAVDASGNVYVTGGSQGSGTGSDYATVKYNASGIQQWVARYDGPSSNDDLAYGIAVDSSGNVYVTGYSAGSSTGLDYATVKYNSSGAQQWVARYNGFNTANDYAIAIAIDVSGNVYVTGFSDGSGTGYVGYDYATIKYNASGAQQWVERYDGPASNYDTAVGVGVDSSGNVYVTGNSAGSGTGCSPACDDYATIKYNASGTQQWVARYNGPGNSGDAAVAIAIDGTANVYVTGFSVGSGGNYGCATIKYNTSGTQQWIARYDGPGSAVNIATAITVDSSGNVYVTGNTNLPATPRDFLTIKYNTSGTPQWATTYNGSGNDDDFGPAIAVDGSGNVYITGSSTGVSTGYDFATIKYNSSGTQQWVDRYNGAGNGTDGPNGLPFAITVDASGTPYVTGRSRNATDYDYVTIKYYACWPTCSR